MHGVEKSSVDFRRPKKTRAPKFTDFKAVEMTQEVRHDMEVLRLRTFLNPKKHYKGSGTAAARRTALRFAPPVD